MFDIKQEFEFGFKPVAIALLMERIPLASKQPSILKLAVADFHVSIISIFQVIASSLKEI